MSADAPPRLLLRIADNGIGMAPETLARLFSSFSQAEASTTRRFGGTGLGLAICKRLIDLMRGEITVQSAAGEGSVFSVSLPAEPVPGSRARIYPTSAASTASSSAPAPRPTISASTWTTPARGCNRRRISTAPPGRPRACIGPWW